MEAKQCSAVFKPRNFQREERVVFGAEISHYMAVGCISARETWLEWKSLRTIVTMEVWTKEDEAQVRFGTILKYMESFLENTHFRTCLTNCHLVSLLWGDLRPCRRVPQLQRRCSSFTLAWTSPIECHQATFADSKSSRLWSMDIHGHEEPTLCLTQLQAIISNLFQDISMVFCGTGSSFAGGAGDSFGCRAQDVWRDLGPGIWNWWRHGRRGKRQWYRMEAASKAGDFMVICQYVNLKHAQSRVVF